MIVSVRDRTISLPNVIGFAHVQRMSITISYTYNLTTKALLLRLISFGFLWFSNYVCGIEGEGCRESITHYSSSALSTLRWS